MSSSLAILSMAVQSTILIKVKLGRIYIQLPGTEWISA